MLCLYSKQGCVDRTAANGGGGKVVDLTWEVTRASFHKRLQTFVWKYNSQVTLETRICVMVDLRTVAHAHCTQACRDKMEVAMVVWDSANTEGIPTLVFLSHGLTSLVSLWRQ